MTTELLKEKLDIKPHVKNAYKMAEKVNVAEMEIIKNRNKLKRTQIFIYDDLIPLKRKIQTETRQKLK